MEEAIRRFDSVIKRASAEIECSGNLALASGLRVGWVALRSRVRREVRTGEMSETGTEGEEKAYLEFWYENLSEDDAPEMDQFVGYGPDGEEV
jgi:hypothetical protein